MSFPAPFQKQNGGTATTVDYAALSIIPGLMLERTGSGAGTTITPATSVTMTLTPPAGFTLADAKKITWRGHLQCATDGQTLTFTVSRSTSGQLTTSGYNQLYWRVLADGSPAMDPIESYAAANIVAIGAVGNGSGEGIDFEFTLDRHNDTTTHKTLKGHLKNFRSDDDLYKYDLSCEALSTETLDALIVIASSGDVTGYYHVEAEFG